MALFWYPELNDKIEFEEKPDKGLMLSSYVAYFLARLQSMFIYDGLPESIPQKWLENYLLVNGWCVWVKNGEDLIVTNAGIGADPDCYYIPTKAIVSNPYVKETTRRTYTRDVDCVVMFNDTYSQGLLPMLKKYCAMLVEAEVSLNLACQFSRSNLILSATTDRTMESAKKFIKDIIEGKVGVIGEAQFTMNDHDLTVNKMTGADSSLTNLIEYTQYIKASLYNDLGLQANYNMKREAINSGESQLTEDQLHPLIDNMLAERRQALEKVNAMFGTNISVRFNSAWEINEREEEAAIEQLEATTEQTEMAVENADTNANMLDNSMPNGNNGSVDDNTSRPEPSDQEEEGIEGTPEEPQAEQVAVEVTITDQAIEEIAQAVEEKLNEGEDNGEDEPESDT